MRRKKYIVGRSCASILAAEIICSAGAGNLLEEYLIYRNFSIPEQHYEDFYLPDRLGLNQDLKTPSVTGTTEALIFTELNNNNITY